MYLYKSSEPVPEWTRGKSRASYLELL